MLFSIIVSVVIMIFWFQRFLATNKLWYFQTSGSAIVVGVARFWYFVAPFLAIAFFCFGISRLWTEDPYDPAYKISVYWTCTGFMNIIIGFICGFLQPNWLSPAWLRRLRREYGQRVIELMIDDAIDLEKYELQRRTETWEALKAWAKSLQ